MLDSAIMDMPAHYLKLWMWMLNNASWKDGTQIKKGQLLTSIAAMQKAGGHSVGYRRVDLTKDQVRSCYEALTKQQMIATTKTTRGMIITICNYSKFQTVENYEAHNEALKQTTRSHLTPHTIVEEGEEGNKEPIAVSKKQKRAPSGNHQFFIAWWEMAFQKVFASKPTINAKAGTLVKEMLSSVGDIKRLIAYASVVLTSEDQFYEKTGRTLGVLSSQIESFKSRKNSYDIALWRSWGIAPPEGVKLEEWKFWEATNGTAE